METPKKKGRFIVRFFPDKNKVTDKLPTDAPQTQVSISAVEGSSHIAVGHKRMPESSKSLYLYDEDMQSMPRTVTFLDSFKFHLDSMGTYPSEKAEKRAATISHKAKLGTLLGVYLPTIQHIMGLLMFIRHSWIVGHCGLIECLLMVSLCCLTTFFTVISWQLLKHTDSSSRIFEHKQLKSKDKLTKAAADMQYVTALTNNLRRVLFVRGSGKEVVSLYS